MIRFVLLGGVGRVPHLSKPQIGCADVNDPVGRGKSLPPVIIWVCPPCAIWRNAVIYSVMVSCCGHGIDPVGIHARGAQPIAWHETIRVDDPAIAGCRAAGNRVTSPQIEPPLASVVPFRSCTPPDAYTYLVWRFCGIGMKSMAGG